MPQQNLCTNLRQHFQRLVGVAPSDYRRTFSRTTEPVLAAAELSA